MPAKQSHSTPIPTPKDQPVAISSPLHADSMTGAASGFFGNSSSTAPRRQSAPEQGKQECAMARRLEQLHTALGETDGVPDSSKNIPRPAAAIQSTNTVGTGSLVTTGLLAALLGASLTWLALQTPPLPAEPTAYLQAAARPIPVPASAPTAAKISDKAKIGNLLENWRKAWTQRDIAGYLNSYSQRFVPTDGQPRATWAAARTQKLAPGAPIDIQIRELGIERLNADQFKATFLQDYASGSYRETARTKTLLVARENGEWKITREWMTENGVAGR